MTDDEIKQIEAACRVSCRVCAGCGLVTKLCDGSSVPCDQCDGSHALADRLCAALREAWATIAMIEAERARRLKDLEVVEAERDALRAHADDLAAKSHAFRAERDDLRAERDALKAMVERAQALAGYQAQASIDALAASDAERDALRALLTAAQAHATIDREAAVEMEKQRDEAQGERDEAWLKIAQLHGDVIESHKAMLAAQFDRDALHAEVKRLRPFESLGPCGAHGEAARREFVCSGPGDHRWHDERCRGFRVWKDNGKPVSAINLPESPDSSQAAPKGAGVE